MKSSYDVIVIGAGSVGVPLSYFLAEMGYSVLCLDKNSSAGQGQNKAAIGGVRATHSDPAKIKICQKSLEIFSNWEEWHGKEIGWKKGGYCFPVYRVEDERLLKSMLPIQKRFDLKIDWYHAEKIEEFVPGINTEGLRGGTFSPEDGQVNPLKAIDAIEEAASTQGAEFKYRCLVTGLILKGDEVEAVKTDKGVFKAGVVVNAAGAFAKEIGEMAGLKIPVEPESHEAGISAPVKDFLGPLVVDIRPGKEGKTKNFYFGQNTEHAFIFCYTPEPPIVGRDRRCTSEFMPIIASRLVHLIPRLKNLTVRRVWRGLYPMTPDGVPIVGKAPQFENLYLAVGMCGQGFMLGPGVGWNLARLISKGKPDVEEKIFKTLSPDRNFYTGNTEILK